MKCDCNVCLFTNPLGLRTNVRGFCQCQSTADVRNSGWGLRCVIYVRWCGPLADPLPEMVTLAVALAMLAPPLGRLVARQVYRAGLFTTTRRMEATTSPMIVSSTEAPEI